MKIEPTLIAGVFRLSITRIEDDRGFFARTYSPDVLAAAGIDATRAQSNLGRSTYAYTLRGMHYQEAPHGETKLVRCTRGRLFDVAVDLREGSATRLRWVGFELSAESWDMVVIPPGCAHGYLSLEDQTDLVYDASVPYVPTAARGVRFDDPALDIEWPATPRIISDKDLSWQLLNAVSPQGA